MRSNSDFTQLKEFADGDNDFIKDIFNTFLKDAESNWAIIENSFAENKLQDLKGIAHKLKSSFRFLGNQKLGEMAYDIEKMALDIENKSTIENIIKEMKVEFDYFILDIKDELQVL